MLDGREITRFSGEKQRLSTQGQQVRLLEMTLRQKILSTIADPNMALLLGVVGLLGLYLEFTNPGLMVPGVAGGICFLLALLGFSLLPINLIGVLLVLLAIGLFIAELTVQGFGFFGAGGIVAMTMGLLLLIDAPNPEVRIQLGLALAVAVSVAAIMLFLVRLAIRSHLARVTTGRGALEGLIAQARTDINQEGGKVFLQGEWWEAVSQEPISRGSKVRVLTAENLLLTVEPDAPSDTPLSEEPSDAVQ